MICNNCGFVSSDNARYCGYCGALLVGGQMPQNVYECAYPYNWSCELFRYNQIVIDQVFRGINTFTKDYNICTPDGTVVGSIIQNPIGKGEAAVRVVMGRRVRFYQSACLSVFNERNEFVGSYTRDGLIRHMNDRNNRLIGTIERECVRDENGQAVVLYTRDALAKCDVYYVDGRQYASMKIQWNGVGKTIFSNTNKYLIEFADGTSELHKLIAILFCVNLDFSQ